MRTWLETLETDQLERAMNNRFRRKLTPDGDAQQVVYSALRAEDDGDLVEARKSWLQLASMHAQPKNADEQGWAWLARRKLKVIDDLPGLEKRLIDAREKPDFTPAGEAERRAWTAVRFETIGDIAAAMEEFGKLGKDFEKDASARGYVILAAAKRRTLRDQLPGTAEAAAQNRRAVLQARLDELERLIRDPTPFHVRKARCLARDVADLYGSVSDPEVQRLVRQVASRAAALPGDKESR
jgi:hypothetical protein